MPYSHISNIKLVSAITIIAALLAILGGTITLAGWSLDYPILTDWRSQGISMFPNAALCSILSGISLLGYKFAHRNNFSIRALSNIFCTALALIAALTILENIFNFDFGIDTVISDKPWGQRGAHSPMRMGLPASLSFLLIATSLSLMRTGRMQRRLSSHFALAVFGISILSLVGYWFGADQLFGIARITAIAWQTSLILAVLSLGIMFALPEHGIVSAVISNDAGGAVMSRLILPVIFIPLFLGWIRIAGVDQGYFDEAFGTAIRTILEIIVFVGLLWWTAESISAQSRMLRLADRRKNEFLATLSHELRNPLAAIVNSLEIIKMSPGSDEKINSSSAVISRQIAHLVRLVDDLLDVSRISHDKLELKMSIFSLKELANQASEAFIHLIRAKNQQIEIKLPDKELILRADLVRMVQIIFNLVSNASKFTQAGGKISLTAEIQEDKLIIEISDNGIGIPSSKLPQVFEMFSQVGRSLEQKAGGLGVGLALVKRLVELHKGSITVDSAGEGKGTTFSLKLPIISRERHVIQTSEDVKQADRILQSTAGRNKILIIEDNIDTAITLAMLLKDRGYETSTVHDGLEGLKEANRFRPEIILLDIGLPGLNGFNVCRQLRLQPWARYITIIALTGWGQEKDLEKSREAGFSHHLVKPVDHSALLKVISSFSLNRAA